MNSAKNLRAKTAVRRAGFKNDKVDGFLTAKGESVGSIQFVNGEIIHMIMPNEFRINFNSQLFELFSRIKSFTT